MIVDDDNKAGLLFGYVSAVDAATCRIRVRLDDRDGLETHWVHVPQRNTHDNRHRSLPDLGGHVAIMMSANGVEGVYLGAIYSDAAPPPITDHDTEYVRFQDGTVVSYDRKENKLLVDCVGVVEIITADSALVKAGTSVTLETPETIVTGRLTVQDGLRIFGGSEGSTVAVTGDISIQGNIDATGSIMDAAGNSNHHSH